MQKYSLEWAIDKANKTQGWLKTEEGHLLYNLASIKNDGFVIEIGSYKGKSSTILASASIYNNLDEIICVDPHKKPEDCIIKDEYDIWTKEKYSDSWDDFINNINSNEVGSYIIPIKHTSEDAIKIYRLKYNKMIRGIFIDGMHDREYVQKDYDFWSPYLIDGGWIAFHDSNPGNIDYAKSAGIVAQKEIVDSGLYEWGRICSITWGIKKNLQQDL